jgi:undecaprenyl-diphosphatase
MSRTQAQRHQAGITASTTEAHRNPVLLAAGLASLAVTAGLATVVAGSVAPDPLDRWWLSRVTGWQSSPLTWTGKVLSYICGPWGGTVVAVALVLLLLHARRVRTAAFVALADGCGEGASQLIKHLVARPRPAHPLVRADFGSFPSGHVITTVVVGLVLVAVLCPPGRRRLPLAAVAAAGVIMMFFRSYLRAHWLTDTFESVAVACGIVLVLWWWSGPALTDERRRLSRQQSHLWRLR